MNSHLLKLAKNIIILTLIAGFFVMPLAPILADETSSSEVVVEPVIEPTIVEPAIDPADVVVADEDVAEEGDVLEVPAEEPIIIVPALPVVEDSLDTPENDFLTLPEGVLPPEEGNETGEESDFSTLPGEVIDTDNLAISEENDFAFYYEPGDDLVFGGELSFSTLVDPVLPTDAVVSDENSFVTLAIVPPVNPELSPEYSFATLEIVVDLPVVSDENSFVTLPTSDEDNLAIGDELSFVTLPQSDDEEVIGDEFYFNTLDNDIPDEDPVVSDEFSFVTLDNPNDDDIAISDEFSFVTLPNTDDNLAISDEFSFVTLDNPTDDNLAISEEMSFITLDNDDDDDGASGEYSFTTESNSGGGGGGGGGSTIVPVEKSWVCELFLKKFIKYGANNDRREVAKLQAFLRVFEGFSNLRITGYYDIETYRAVETFQKRYSRDVLGPWGIDDSTGYVYITTTLTINSIYCNRDTRNGLDLRDIFAREYEQAMGEPFDLDNDNDGYTIATDTPATSTDSVVKRNWLLAGLGNLFDFIGDNLCWLLNLLLLLVIFFLLWLLWLAGRDKQEEESTVVGKTGDNSNITNASLGMVSAVALEELMTKEDEAVLAEIAKEEDEEAEILNNDPDQENLLTKL